MQVTVSFTVGDEGVQLMLLITGAATTVTVVESLSLPPPLPTVSKTVLLPAELQLGE